MERDARHRPPWNWNWNSNLYWNCRSDGCQTRGPLAHSTHPRTATRLASLFGYTPSGHLAPSRYRAFLSFKKIHVQFFFFLQRSYSIRYRAILITSSYFKLDIAIRDYESQSVSHKSNDQRRFRNTQQIGRDALERKEKRADRMEIYRGIEG